MESRTGNDDYYRVGQTAHVGRHRQPAGVSINVVGAVRPLAIAGAAALAAGVLAGCGSSPASVKTHVVAARDAVIQTATGKRVAVRLGAVVPRGAALITGAAGSAVLDTGGRETYLGSTSDYVVGTGVSAELRRGAAVVDARRGPDLRLVTGAVAVSTGHSAIRVERGFTVRVGVFAGNAAVTALPAAGVPLTVDALHQVVVAGRGLPAHAAPLVLTDDDAERRVAPDLVHDDLDLGRTAAALDSGRQGRRLVAVAVHSGLPVPVAAASASRVQAANAETALPLAMARAAVGAGGSVGALTDSYVRARDLRRAGGSWGVVAALLGTNATATGHAIDVLLAGPAPVITAAGPATGPGSGPGARHSGPGGRPAPSLSPNSGDTQSPTPQPRPTGTPRPSPSPSSSQSSDVVGTVLNLLSPSPSAPSQQQSSGRPSHRPHPVPVPSCLLLHLLCH
jgi:hypothetical protein